MENKEIPKDNFVIKCLSLEHGQKLKQFFESLGVNTYRFGFNWTVADNYSHCYYGLHNGKFDNFLEDFVRVKSLQIIELPEERKLKSLHDLTNKDVVNVTSEEEDLSFRQLLHKEGFKRIQGHCYLDTECYNDYKNRELCYNVKFGQFWSKYWYEKQGYTIHQASDFLKTNIKTNMQKIAKKDLQEIYNIACNDWKQKIREYALHTGYAFNDYIELFDSEVEEMFKAATKEQKPILEKYFKKPEEEFDASMLKGGEAMSCNEGDIRFIIRNRFSSNYTIVYKWGTTNGIRDCNYRGKKLPTGTKIEIVAE